MKKFLLLLIVHSTLCIVNCYSQQYGWVDISNNLPSSNGTVTLPDMHWISDNEGWFCSGLLGEIYHTTNGGQTFETQTTQFYTNAIYMLNSQLGYAGGNQGRVYKTTNGGADWVVNGSIGSNLRDIDFPPNSDSGYCCGDNGTLSIIKSSGVFSMSSGVVGNLRSISFPSSNLGWACGNGLILKYEEIWFQQDPPLEGYNSIFMIDDTIGWAVGSAGVILKTENGGDSGQWNYQTNPDISRDLNDVFFLNKNEGWTAGSSGVILHTTNGGEDWNIILDGWTTNMLRSVQFTSSTNGYILGNNKTLFKYGLLTEVEQQPTQPTEFKLEQNYPNPFNPTTMITYHLRKTAYVELKVYDVIGNEIVTLVDEEKAASDYEVDFDATKLSSGVYFYQLRAGDYLTSKKMIYLK